MLARFRVSATSVNTKLLNADVDLMPGLRDQFARHQYPTTKALHEKIHAASELLSQANASVAKTPVMRELPKDERRDHVE